MKASNVLISGWCGIVYRGCVCAYWLFFIIIQNSISIRRDVRIWFRLRLYRQKLWSLERFPISAVFNAAACLQMNTVKAPGDCNLHICKYEMVAVRKRFIHLSKANNYGQKICIFDFFISIPKFTGILLFHVPAVKTIVASTSYPQSWNIMWNNSFQEGNIQRDCNFSSSDVVVPKLYCSDQQDRLQSST